MEPGLSLLDVLLSFQVDFRQGYIYQHRVNITPGGCPRAVNREILAALVESYSGVWRTSAGSIMPVYDGRDKLYTAEPLPRLSDKAGNPNMEDIRLEVTLAGADGRDRLFSVDIRFEMKISLFELQSSIDGYTRHVPRPRSPRWRPLSASAPRSS